MKESIYNVLHEKDLELVQQKECYEFRTKGWNEHIFFPLKQVKC